MLKWIKIIFGVIVIGFLLRLIIGYIAFKAFDKNGEITSPHWRYDVIQDKMRGTFDKYAQIESLNLHEFNFPYGKQKINLIIRKSDSAGFDVYFTGNVNFMCSSSGESRISVKFDDEKIVKYTCLPSDTNWGEAAFIKKSQSFFQNLKTANHMIIEADFFDGGMVQYEFDVTGLDATRIN